LRAEGRIPDVPPSRIGGAIMLTDGQVHDVPGAPGDGFNAPLHGLITGKANEFDRRIEVESAPRFGIVGKDQARACASSTTAARGRRRPDRAATARSSRAQATAGRDAVQVQVRIERGGATSSRSRPPRSTTS
jgi:hypothetical protein